MFRWLQRSVHFRDLTHYIIASTIIFASGVYLGYGSPQVRGVAESAFESMRKIAGMLEETEHTQLWFFVFIFLNNAIKSVFFVLSGAVFGIMPIYVLLMNGIIIGYLFFSLPPETNAWGLLIKGLLPHGVIELPMLILACAFGMRFGTLVLKLLSGIFIPRKKEAAVLEFRSFVPQIVPFIVMLTIALFAAAVIESTVSYTLLR